MIYAASLSAPVKKAYGDKCYSTNILKIIEQLSVDPSVSGMSVCVVGPKDAIGVNKAKLQAGLRTKHPDVCVVYICTKDKEADIIDTPFKKVLKKVTPDAIKEAVDSFIDSSLVGSGKTVVSRDTKVSKPITSRPVDKALGTGAAKGKLARSASSVASQRKQDKAEKELEFDPALELYYFLDPLGNMVYCDKDTRRPLRPAQVQAQKERIRKQGKEIDEQSVQEVQEENYDFVPAEPAEKPAADVSVPEPEVPDVGNPMSFNTSPQASSRPVNSLEKSIENIRDFRDWNLFKEMLSKDTAIRELLEENSQFQGCVQMLSLFDEEIKSVYYNPGFTAEQKFEKVLEIGGRRSTITATHNDILSKKVLSIMEAVTVSARKTVEETLAAHRKAMEQIVVSNDSVVDENKLTDLISNRAKAEFDLLSLLKGIITLYQAMDMEVSDVILNLDKKLPSDNEFINNMVGSAGDILTPTNSKEVAVTMMRALQGHREQFALLEESVKKVIDAIHNLLQKDADIIEYQQFMIRTLKAHRVEDAVVIDGVLKNVLHIYVGTDNTGRTATTLTLAGVMSRRRNTLLIDLTKDNKLRNYGVEPVQLDEFTRTRIERQLCVVEGSLDDSENVMETIAELKTRLDYYPHIMVTCDAEDTKLVAQLAENALSVNFITNCTTASLEAIADAYKKMTVENVARKVIMIDPPIDILRLATKMEVDVTMTKCISVPNLSKIKMCSVVMDKPYEYSEVRNAFDEAFR